MGERERFDPDELEGHQPSVLPAREAMSLISPDSSAALTPFDTTPVTPDGVGTAAAPAVDDATADHVATDAQASGSGEESVTSEDRSEQISNQDTATSQT